MTIPTKKVAIKWKSGQRMLKVCLVLNQTRTQRNRKKNAVSGEELKVSVQK